MEEMNKTPRSPIPMELNKVIEFLNKNLRLNIEWPITKEYPTALSSANIHNMSIITDAEEKHILSHAVLKPFICKTPYAVFKIGAIGSVVTDPQVRNRGLSSQNLKNCMTKAEEQDCDFTILWSDQYDFYRRLGFELAGYEYSYQISKALPQQEANAKFIKGTKIDPSAILKLYNQHTVNSVRTLEEVSQYLNIPNSHVYTMWSNQNQLLAYAVEGKGVDLQNYIHEWGGSVPHLVDLISYMISSEGESYTFICPRHSFNLRQKLKSICDLENDGFLGLIKINNFDKFSAKIKKIFSAEGVDNIIFEKNENQIVFGHKNNLYTLKNEADLVRLVFGPTQMSDLSFVDENTQKIFSKIFPLPLWVWGWDSV